jgi:hypothetical protein
VTPLAGLILAKLGSAAPMSRHLIFILPFFSLVVAEGVIRVAALGRRAAPIVAVVGIAALLPAEVAWGWHRTPELYRGEATSHVHARAAASGWLAAAARPDDVLFGYEPLYMQAWGKGGKVSKLVIPRADYRLALTTLESARKPLGQGVWVFDASDTTNGVRRPTIPLLYPEPAADFQADAFGPFLVVRTVKPTRCIRTYLKLARRVELVGASLGLGDADVNLATVLQASGRFAAEKNPGSC